MVKLDQLVPEDHQVETEHLVYLDRWANKVCKGYKVYLERLAQEDLQAQKVNLDILGKFYIHNRLMKHMNSLLLIILGITIYINHTTRKFTQNTGKEQEDFTQKLTN